VTAGHQLDALLALLRNRVTELRRLELAGVGGAELGRRRHELDNIRRQLAELAGWQLTPEH